MSWPTRILFVLFVFVFTILSSNVSNAQPNDDPLKRLNGEFRKAYAATRAEVLRQSGPIILVRGDYLVLIDGEERIEGSRVDQAYHDLKTVAHVPLAIYARLALQKDGPIDNKLVAGLDELKQLIELSQRSFENRLDDDALENRQRALLQSCTDFLNQLLASQKHSKKDLVTLCKSCLPQIQENLEVAAKYRIDNYHQQAVKWRKTLGEDKWSKMHVLIPGASMPRVNHLAVQYFAKLLGQRGEGARIVYAESQFVESQAMNHLGTHLFDTQIGTDFFSDPWRMHRDALGTAAARYLETLDVAP